MWGAIIGAAVSAAGGIASGIMSAKANKKAKAELNKQKSENEAWYNRRYNEDYLNTAEAQHALSQARESAMRQMNQARGVQAVMGGTDDSVLQTQREANSMLANTESQLAAQGQARKDSIESQYMARAQDISNKYAAMYQAQAKNIANAGAQMGQAGMQLVSADMTRSALLDKGGSNSSDTSKEGLFKSMFSKNGSQSAPVGIQVPDPGVTTRML